MVYPCNKKITQIHETSYFLANCGKREGKQKKKSKKFLDFDFTYAYLFSDRLDKKGNGHPFIKQVMPAKKN